MQLRAYQNLGKLPVKWIIYLIILRQMSLGLAVCAGPCGSRGKGKTCRGFFAEMVLEELDSAGEWFSADGKLYVFPNATSTGAFPYNP